MGMKKKGIRTAFCILETRAKDMITLTAEQRYFKLRNEHPGIIQNISLQYIDS